MMRTYTEVVELAASGEIIQPSIIAPHLPKPISNFTVEETGEGGEQNTPIPMRDIIITIMEQTDGWPRRVGGCLFIQDEGGVHWLENSSALFGWLSSRSGVIEWAKSTGCVTKEELFQELCRTAESYISVEELPHFPPLPRHYYACGEFPAGDDGALTKLIEYFAPATDHDKMLILAMFATPFWGGKPGSRPAFLVTSDVGRGVGKSKITDMLSLLTGGHIELSAGEEASRMRSRLLSPEGLKKRIARLDNVKSLKFSWAELESIITSPLISGHRLHQGEAGRPNNLTWIITLNGASLGTDMAQRVVTIKLSKPNRIGCWEEDVVNLIEGHGDEIIAGLRSFLESDPQPMPDHSRWASWEDQVLSRLVNPWAIQKEIRARSDTSNVDYGVIEQIEEHFEERLTQLGYGNAQAVHVPVKVAGIWVNEASGTKREYESSFRSLRQYCNEGFTKSISENRSNKYGRGFVFKFENHIDAPIQYDLKEKLKAEQQPYIFKKGTEGTEGDNEKSPSNF